LITEINNNNSENRRPHFSPAAKGTEAAEAFLRRFGLLLISDIEQRPASTESAVEQHTNNGKKNDYVEHPKVSMKDKEWGSPENC